MIRNPKNKNKNILTSGCIFYPHSTSKISHFQWIGEEEESQKKSTSRNFHSQNKDKLIISKDTLWINENPISILEQSAIHVIVRFIFTKRLRHCQFKF